MGRRAAAVPSLTRLVELCHHGSVPPALIEPGTDHHGSFLAALVEYHREGRHTDLDVNHLADASTFRRWLDEQHHAGLVGAAEIERDRVPHRVLWWVDGPEYLGRLRINLVLNEELSAFGGHLGYDVRPSARGCGHATAMLAAGLELASHLDLDEVLLTCAEDNDASRRVIERNGGRFLDISTAGRMRFVCTTDLSVR